MTGLSRLFQGDRAAFVPIDAAPLGIGKRPPMRGLEPRILSAMSVNRKRGPLLLRSLGIGVFAQPFLIGRVDAFQSKRLESPGIEDKHLVRRALHHFLV